MIKVDLHYKGTGRYQIDAYLRFQQVFKAYGIQFRFYPDSTPNENSDADIFVLQASAAGKTPLNLKRPVILEEKEDSAMPISRRLIKLPNVIRCFKVGVVKANYMNVPSERVHLWLSEGVPSWPERWILTAEDCAKIVPGAHFGMFDRIRPWVERALRIDSENWPKRPIDALFVGSTVYDTPGLTRHRTSFYEALRAAKGLNVVAVPARSMHGRDYFELSRQAKVVVSPWGYGELCYRDFEAMLDGCVLLKPDTSFVMTLDGILTAGSTYEPCLPDGSDLELRLRNILADPAYADPERRRQTTDKLLKWWRADVYADWWTRELTAALS